MIGTDEGCQRFQSSTNFPVTRVARSESMYRFREIGRTCGGQKATTIAYSNLIKQLEQEVIGMGHLTGQKVIMSMAGISFFYGKGWLNHFIPGSGQHLKHLAAPPFLLKTAPEVKQLLVSIARNGDENGPMVLSKADEIICQTSKEDARGGDIAYRGWSPCFDEVSRCF